MKEKLLKNIKNGIPMVHLSIDDCLLGLQEVFSGNYGSLFDSDYFEFLRGLHNDTGVVITSFLFYENENFNLAMTDSRYRQDFNSNHWLKFQVHARNRQTPMTNQTTEEVSDTIDQINDAMFKFVGKENFATSWRPHYFSANRDACNLMRRQSDVLLTADDRRKVVACLSPDVVKRMWNGGYYDDEKSGFLLLNTSFRIEDSTMGVKEMKSRVDEDIRKHGISAIYTHEYCLVGCNGNFKQIRDKTRRLLKHAKENGYEFIA